MKLKRYPLASFFIVAYAISWILWSPAVASDQESSPGVRLLIIIGGFGPLFSAVIVTRIVEGRAGLRELRNRLFKWRVDIQWYLVALLLPIIGSFSIYGLYILLGGKSLDLSSVPPWYAYFPAFLFVLLLGGGQEEPGWRGFALPRLQTKYNALVASFILGMLWAFWHFPLFFAVAAPQSDIPFVWYIPHVIATTITFTWIYNNTGSVFLPMLFHAGLNVITSWFPIESTEGAMSLIVPTVIVEWLIAIILIVVYGPARLSRKPTS